MFLHVVAAEYRGGQKVWLEFSDGTAGEADLTAVLGGPMFEPLRDPQKFAEVQLSAEAHTIVWPNGAGFAPEFLRSLVAATNPVSAKTAR